MNEIPRNPLTASNSTGRTSPEGPIAGEASTDQVGKADEDNDGSHDPKGNPVVLLLALG